MARLCFGVKWAEIKGFLYLHSETDVKDQSTWQNMWFIMAEPGKLLPHRQCPRLKGEHISRVVEGRWNRQEDMK